MANRTYGYLQGMRRPRRTTCATCGSSKYGPASGDPTDHKSVCHSMDCPDNKGYDPGYMKGESPTGV
jgi:hypothetical protein